MSILYYLPIFLMHITAAQFPDHTDLQKVGEIIFNNEIYNVLKPTVHKITDHFKDFMMRRENNKNEKIFIDDNGFRHFWSGLGGRIDSLRKTEVTLHEANKGNENEVAKDNANDNINSEDNLETNSENEAVEDEDTDNATDTFNNEESTTTVAVRKKPIRPKTSLEEEEAEKDILRAAKGATTKAKPGAATTAKGKAAAATTAKPKPAAVTTAKPKAANTAGKKLAKVSFFCPFFGVITMTSFID